jgi:hypothetical protein
MIIIMRATLHDHAPNTYYGQWLRKRSPIHRVDFGRHCPRGSAKNAAHQCRTCSRLAICPQSRRFRSNDFFAREKKNLSVVSTGARSAERRDLL